MMQALSSPVLSVREAAATAILAAQLVLRDETLLFSLLEGLTPERIHLLTYLCVPRLSSPTVERC